MAIQDKLVFLFKAPKQDEESDKYEVELKENGFHVNQLKTLDFVYKNLELLKQKLEQPKSYNGIIFSSPRCVYGVKNALNDFDLHNCWKEKYNYVVGNGTCETALKYLNLSCDGKESGNANNLGDIIIASKYIALKLFKCLTIKCYR